jgi:hypothetical protein
MKLDSLFEKQAAGSSVAVYARRLSRIWKQLQRSHVPVAIGCSCGAGFNHVKMQDLEQDVLDYLFDKYSRAGVPSLVRALHSFADISRVFRGA